MKPPKLTDRLDYSDVIIIPFSGGYDSTLILLSECERLTKYNDKEPWIILEYFDDCIIKEDKRNIEKGRAILVVNKIKELFPDLNIKLDIVTFRQDFNFHYNNRRHFKQVAPQSTSWMGILHRILSTTVNVERLEVLLGLNYSDGSTYTAKKIKEDLEFWYYKTKEPENEFDVEFNVAFPLAFEDKATILKYILVKYPEVYDLIWYCEEPVLDMPCGRCKKCVEINNALRKLELEIDESISYYTETESIKRKLKDFYTSDKNEHLSNQE